MSKHQSLSCKYVTDIYSEFFLVLFPSCTIANLRLISPTEYKFCMLFFPAKVAMVSDASKSLQLNFSVKWTEEKVRRRVESEWLRSEPEVEDVDNGENWGGMWSVPGYGMWKKSEIVMITEVWGRRRKRLSVQVVCFRRDDCNARCRAMDGFWGRRYIGCDDGWRLRCNMKYPATRPFV